MRPSAVLYNYLPKAIGTDFDTAPNYAQARASGTELSPPLTLTTARRHFDTDRSRCFICQSYVDPLSSLIPPISVPVTATIPTRPQRRLKPQLLHNGLSGRRAPAAVVLDSLHVPKTWYKRGRLPQIHERGPRTAG